MDIVPRDVEHYAEAHSSPPPEHLLALAVETELALDFPQMMVGALEGRFLEMLVYALAPMRILEIGTFSGYSALSMAAGLPEGGRITTCDISEKHLEVARRFIEQSPYAAAIEIREGPALDTIATLDGPFDFVFIDADKENYINYYEAVLPKLSPRGLIAADNTLWGGRVLDVSDTSSGTVGIRAFNDHVRDDPRTEQVQLTVRDGVTLIRKV